MKRNVSGQKIGVQMVSATDGSAFTDTVTVYVTIDAGSQAVGSVGSGECVHEGNGYHTYAPAQAETNGDLIAFTFTGTGAVPVTLQVFTSYPQTGDAYDRLGAPAGASIAADLATIDNFVDDLEGRVIGTIAAGTHNPQSGDAYAIVNNGTYGLSALKTLIDTLDNYVDTEVASIITELAKVPKSDGVVSWNATALGAIKTAIEAAGSHLALIKAETDKLATAMELDGAVYRFTENALEEGSTGGAAPTVDQIRDAIIDDATRIDASALNTLSGHDPGATLVKVADLPAAAPSAASIAALILETPANKIETDANGYVTANVNGSIEVSGDVTLAAAQPNYAPAKATDIPSADITAIKGVTDKLNTALVLDGSVYKYTANALEEAPSSAGDVTLAATQPNYAPAKAGDAMALTSSERTSIAAAVWASTTRTLSSFGTLVADVAAAVWAAVSRTLTGGITVSGDVTLAASQPNYAPAKAGDQMDLVAAPNATALAAVRTAVEANGGKLDAVYDKLPSGAIGDATISNQADIADAITALGSPMQAGASVEVSDKTGFSLASDGLDAVAAPADLTNDTEARASFVGMIRALFNRFFNKVTQDNAQQIIYNDSDAVVSTKATSDDGTTQTLGRSS